MLNVLKFTLKRLNMHFIEKIVEYLEGRRMFVSDNRSSIIDTFFKVL